MASGLTRKDLQSWQLRRTSLSFVSLNHESQTMQAWRISPVLARNMYSGKLRGFGSDGRLVGNDLCAWRRVQEGLAGGPRFGRDRRIVGAARFYENCYAACSQSPTWAFGRAASLAREKRYARGERQRVSLPVLRAVLVERPTCSRKFLPTVNLSYPVVAPVLLREPGLGPQC